MKLVTPFLVAATLLGTTSVSHPAGACGPERVDDMDFAVPPPADRVTQLLQEAARLDARARDLDGNAGALERGAETLALRARELRNLALGQGDFDRARLVAQANQLSAQAALRRASAQESRAEAEQLRLSARETRQRAARLAGGGMRPRPWRGGVAQTI